MAARDQYLDRDRLTVAESLSEVDGRLVFKAPKSRASRWTIAPPGPLEDTLEDHLRQ